MNVAQPTCLFIPFRINTIETETFRQESLCFFAGFDTGFDTWRLQRHYSTSEDYSN